MGLKINKKISLIPKIIGWVLLVILVIAMTKILVWENGYYKNKSQEERAESTPVLTEVLHVLNPDETQPSPEQISKHQVEANQPRYIDISRLDVQARFLVSVVL